MSKIEIRFGRRLVIRAAGRTAVAIAVLGLLTGRGSLKRLGCGFRGAKERQHPTEG